MHSRSIVAWTRRGSRPLSDGSTATIGEPGLGAIAVALLALSLAIATYFA